MIMLVGQLAMHEAAMCEVAMCEAEEGDSRHGVQMAKYKAQS